MQSVTPKVVGVREANDDAGETIDGSTRSAVDDMRPVPPPPVSPANDYPELVQVERHHYVISGEIAKGGMGRVLEARDRRLGRPVAIKELLPRNRDAARRFEREARITARLQHPAIIHVYEAGVWPGGEPFYAMTRVIGRSFDKVVAERKTLIDRLGLLPNVIAVADALAYAHSQNVIHRDLKPSNVLVGEFGETVVIDWGLAKDLAAPADPMLSLQIQLRPADETLTGSVVGTPAYMPPEQARGDGVDQRSDVYALGALLYQVLVGSAPYTGSSSSAVLEQVLAGPPVPADERELGAPADLVTIVGKAMARDPDGRYISAGELAADLKRFQTGQLVAAHHYTRGQLFWRWVRRHRLVIGIATSAFLALAILGAISVQRILAEKARAVSEQHKGDLRRAALLEERGRTELLAGRAGPALANLVGAVRGRPGGALGFLIADAMRPFESEVASITAGTGNVIVAYRPDGTLIATATSDGRVALWNPKDGTLVRELEHGHGRIRAISWDPVGAHLATGGDDAIARIWAVDGQLVRALAGHKGAIGDVSFGTDARYVATASADGSARVWDLETGDSIGFGDKPRSKKSATLEGHDGEVTSARLSPDGTRLVTAGIDTTAIVWVVRPGERPGVRAGERPSERAGDVIMPLRGHDKVVHVAKWNAAGDLVLTASGDGTARIWDPEKGKLAVAPLNHDSNADVEDASWSFDGTRVITAGGNIARIWELPDPPIGDAPIPFAVQVALLPHTDTVVAATFSPDDRWIATAGRVARVWDAAGQPVAAFEHADLVRTMAFHPDGHTLVAGTRGGTARIWDVTGRIVRDRLDLESPVHAIAIGRDGAIAVGTDDSRVVIWRGNQPKTVLRNHLGRVFALAFSPNGTQLLSAGDDPMAFVSTVGSAAAPLQLRGWSGPIHAVAFSPDGATIAIADEAGVLRLWSSATGKLVLASRSIGGALNQIAYSPRGDLIVGAAANGTLIVWSADGKVLAHQVSAESLGAVAFDPTGTLIVVGGRGDTRILRITGSVLEPMLTIAGATSDVRSVAFTADGSRVITAGGDGVARVWDAVKGKLLATRDPHGGPIDAIALSADDEVLWTASADGTARAWEIHAVRDPAKLAAFLAAHVPWRLDDDDVVRRESDKIGGP